LLLTEQSSTAGRRAAAVLDHNDDSLRGVPNCAAVEKTAPVGRAAVIRRAS
jgi:hypothetical protein